MTGIEYMNNVCPTTRNGKDPNREDVADAFEDGIAEGFTQGELRGVWTAIEYLVLYEDQPSMAADLARTQRITRKMAKMLRKGSKYADRNRRISLFFKNNRFAGEDSCVEMKIKTEK